jgi:hypothetical protein
MARPGVDGQAGTERSLGVSGGRKPSKCVMAAGLDLVTFSGPEAERRRVSRRDCEEWRDIRVVTVIRLQPDASSRVA